MLFNEPKLLKCNQRPGQYLILFGFSALQRAEIAEIVDCTALHAVCAEFQCSSASRKFLKLFAVRRDGRLN